ncbi:preprotein translocase subunit SecE [Stenoxybacter acetivorans]|uniref:preprotein translocase subunit SecE n=1 Tax=Stenoxybacter acetivorans TaxID=422441 RepID=UPI00068C0087|nr:preprotein translocase subunit SecE [Stenoxybacter acetivorans]
MNQKTSEDVAVKATKLSKTELKQRAQQEERQSKRMDLVKFVLAGLLVAGGLWAFYAFTAQLSVYVRALFPAAGVLLAVVIVFFWTVSGHQLTGYVKESVIEAKKVVWPERTETMRMTLFVMAFVAVLALFIWGVDSVISWLFFDVLMKRS